MPVFLTLGDITFFNNEIPERINFGGNQRQSLKQMVGGERVIDVMGVDYHPVSWSGLFFGSTASYRSQYLYQMMIKGEAIPLTYFLKNYIVVISDFRADFERYYQLPYTITVEIQQDLTSPIPILLPVAYNDVIDELMQEATDLANAIANPSISSALALTAYAINVIPSMANATTEQLQSVLSPLNVTQLATQSAIETLTGSIF